MKTIDCTILNQWLAGGEVLLVDVREPHEHAEKSIAGAVNVPLATVSATTIPDPRGKKLVMQCGGGGRSAKACEALALQGVEAHNLEGGIRGWMAAGLPVKQSAAADPNAPDMCLLKKG